MTMARTPPHASNDTNIFSFVRVNFDPTFFIRPEVYPFKDIKKRKIAQLPAPVERRRRRFGCGVGCFRCRV